MRNDPNWVGDEVLAALNLDKQVFSDADAPTQARRIFEEAAPIAAARIANIAMYSTNEGVALRAASYITDRVLGKNEGASVESPLDAFVSEMVAAAEAEANKNR